MIWFWKYEGIGLISCAQADSSWAPIFSNQRSHLGLILLSLCLVLSGMPRVRDRSGIHGPR